MFILFLLFANLQVLDDQLRKAARPRIGDSS
jgi:hypothetical protein